MDIGVRILAVAGLMAVILLTYFAGSLMIAVFPGPIESAERDLHRLSDEQYFTYFAAVLAALLINIAAGYGLRLTTSRGEVLTGVVILALTVWATGWLALTACRQILRHTSSSTQPLRPDDRVAIRRSLYRIEWEAARSPGQRTLDDAAFAGRVADLAQVESQLRSRLESWRLRSWVGRDGAGQRRAVAIGAYVGAVSVVVISGVIVLLFSEQARATATVMLGLGFLVVVAALGYVSLLLNYRRDRWQMLRMVEEIAESRPDPQARAAEARRRQRASVSAYARRGGRSSATGKRRVSAPARWRPRHPPHSTTNQ
jgi:hypothetical protein